jgi:hypothetical protein
MRSVSYFKPGWADFAPHNLRPSHRTGAVCSREPTILLIGPYGPLRPPVSLGSLKPKQTRLPASQIMRGAYSRARRGVRLSATRRGSRPPGARRGARNTTGTAVYNIKGKPLLLVGSWEWN